MSARTGEFQRHYERAFAAYRVDPGEPALRAAYELGRRAVGDGLSVLDLAAVHHGALLAALADQRRPSEAERVAAAAGDFFLESLSAFEMVQRGFHEARETALVERRQTAMLRQLSSFLADASLALDLPNALEEMLQLVAEQARELVAADWCLASLVVDDGRVPLVSVASSDAGDGARPDIRPESLVKLASLISGHADTARLTAAELAADPTSSALAQLVGATGPIRGRLSARLTALDGRELGSIQLFGKHGGDFTEVDEAILLHLAETASAAVERSRLHELGRRITTATLPAALPEFHALELAVRSIGDTPPRIWYDVVALRDGCAGIAVGEVGPHGVAATLAAGHARTALRACAPCTDTPEDVVAAVSAAVCDHEPELSSSMLYAIVDASRRQARIARAGHPPPLLLAEGEVESAHEALVQLDAGATLVVHAGIAPDAARALVEHGGTEPAAICGVVASERAADGAVVIAVRCRQ